MPHTQKFPTGWPVGNVGFPSYLKNLEKTKKGGVSAALVMNATPLPWDISIL